ncbi:hypothetical protein SAMN05192562_1202 [Kosakonia arachidis]|uniref:Uncharacterized protein n=1 Tax=Kosakonia arachidis TaxID=551989 RepID=A0A1I7ECC8_9ENTR|nr:hypothetical protein [Kosakonia arachidis]SFU21522.1 hypothetical protein SAMN05192562_1202 [Kosakonia arachidis]
MYTGIALYGTEQVTPQEALVLGKSIFTSLGLSVETCGYNQYIKNGDHEGDHELIEVSLAELEEKIAAGYINSFRLYEEKKGHVPWYASFGLSTNDFGSFHHIDIQFPASTDSNIESMLTEALVSVACKYGIAYRCDKVSKSFYYSTGDNLVSLYPYENPSLFKRETPGRFQGGESYLHSKLRMVYPFNMINEHHLNIKIDEMILDRWIVKNNAGQLKKINNSLWMWVVDDGSIDEINQSLGEAGVLISWKQEFTVKKTAKKLP